MRADDTETDVTTEAEERHLARQTFDGYRPAIDHHARALIARIQRDHQDVEAVHLLADHYEQHGDMPSLANLMEGWASTLRDDRNAAEAYLRAAQAAFQGTGDHVRAEALCQLALDRAPELELAQLELEGLLRDRGDTSELDRALSRNVEALRKRNADPKLRARAHERLGELYERMLLPSRAIAQYRSALELDDQATEAITAARDIYLRTGKSEAAADMYELEIAATTSLDRKLVLLRALAEHRQETMSDLDGAVLALRRLLKLSPEDVGALERLADLLRERGATVHGPEGTEDRMRAAELYFQVARHVPRATAQAPLDRCLLLQPEHPRALAMRSELAAYGAPGGGGRQDPEISQAELDRRATGRYTPATVERVATDAPALRSHVGSILPPPDTQADDLVAWLNDDEIELIEEEVGPQNMVSLSDRPPPRE